MQVLFEGLFLLMFEFQQMLLLFLQELFYLLLLFVHFLHDALECYAQFVLQLHKGTHHHIHLMIFLLNKLIVVVHASTRDLEKAVKLFVVPLVMVLFLCPHWFFP
jgi:hypothetical protein